MTAVIVFLAQWRMSRSSQLLPAIDGAIDVAIEHIAWVRRNHPEATPQTTAAMIDRHADTWDEVIRAYADIWENLPESVRRR